MHNGPRVRFADLLLLYSYLQPKHSRHALALVGLILPCKRISDFHMKLEHLNQRQGIEIQGGTSFLFLQRKRIPPRTVVLNDVWFRPDLLCRIRWQPVLARRYQLGNRRPLNHMFAVNPCRCNSGLLGID